MRHIAVSCGVILGTLPLFMLFEPANAVTLDLLPQTQSVTVGQSVILDVQISELGNNISPSVGGFNLQLNYDPAVLTFDDITFSGLIDLSGLDTQTVDSSTPGTLFFVDLSLDLPEELNTAQPDTFSLANIEFIGSGIGTNSPLTLTIIEVSDENFINFDPVTQNDATVTVSSGTTQVPESGLGLTGWGVLLGLFWKITQKKQSL
ncbi:cohesin domain-containing protein [Cyanothece sp. BG0011]|uniref:cohesin domain-containing protein n=1 Tax=Cyanothece sp. BG0011 TaxID=2082950 RepID=UPI0018E50181|nr:cohesin domain-containing protein [Cyanothece sp. BG0011]